MKPMLFIEATKLKADQEKTEKQIFEKEKIKKHNLNAGRNWSSIIWNVIKGEIFNDSVDEKKHITRRKA